MGKTLAHDLRLHLGDADKTDALGRLLAQVLRRGDALLLSGCVGAGKSQLCRALIRARLGRADEDVPSPTFTLVQTYDHAAGDLWHADLYRLGHPEEVVELGLDEAYYSAITLIEWADRLPAPYLPQNPIHIALGISDDGAARLAHLRFDGRQHLADALSNWPHQIDTLPP